MQGIKLKIIYLEIHFKKIVALNSFDRFNIKYGIFYFLKYENRFRITNNFDKNFRNLNYKTIALFLSKIENLEISKELKLRSPQILQCFF